MSRLLNHLIRTISCFKLTFYSQHLLILIHNHFHFKANTLSCNLYIFHSMELKISTDLLIWLLMFDLRTFIQLINLMPDILLLLSRFGKLANKLKWSIFHSISFLSILLRDSYFKFLINLYNYKKWMKFQNNSVLSKIT